MNARRQDFLKRTAPTAGAAALANSMVPKGATSTMTAIMGRMATYSGQTIRWDEALQSDIELKPDRYAWDGTPPITPDENG